MLLDITTLSLALFLVYLGNTFLALFLIWVQQRFPGCRLWVVAQALLTGGALLMLFRPHVDPVLIVASNALFLSALLVFAQALWVFRLKRPFPRPIYFVLIPVVLSLFMVSNQNFALRSLIFSVWAGLGTGFDAVLLLMKREPHSQRVRLLTAIPFGLASVASFFRAVANMIPGIPAGSFEHPEGSNGFYLLGSMLLSTVMLFGYFMMLSLKAQQTLHEKELQILKRNHQLWETNKAKDLFFSLVAHDLRGPIGGAARFARKHLLAKTAPQDERFEAVDTLTASLEKTNEFLEKLLWWSHAQLGAWEPHCRPVELNAALSQAVEWIKPSAVQKNLSLRFPWNSLPTIETDADSLQRILGNLLSNAVKFSLPDREIALSVQENPDSWEIRVEDHGIGMDQKSLEALFKIEQKLSTHGTHGERGSGLGLILARTLALRLGGELTLSSQLGEGTTATLKLPKTRPQEADEARPL